MNRTEKILDWIRNHPNSSLNQVASGCGVSPDTARVVLATLVDLDMVVRVTEPLGMINTAYTYRLLGRVSHDFDTQGD